MVNQEARTFPPPAQNRAAIRLRAEMQSSAAVAGILAFDGDLDRSIIFGLMLREGGALPTPGGRVVAVEPPQPVTINALSDRLLRPFETVRRYGNRLIADGLCTRMAGGVIVRADATDRPEIRQMLTTFHDVLVRLLEDMAHFGMPLPPTRTDIAYDPRVGLAAALDMLLLAVEYSARQYASWFEMVLLETAMCANARGLTYDQDVSMAYADYSTPVPAALRRPVRISVVARALGIPYSTARRHAEGMLHDGRMVRTPGGLMVSESWLASPTLLADREQTADQGRAIFARLAQGGFPFVDPARAYIAGRPPLLAFE